MNDRWEIKRALQVDPHENLYDLATATPEKTTGVPKITNKVNTSVQGSPPAQGQGQISADDKPLAYNIAAVLNCPYKQRGRRLNMSMRQLASAKDELVEKGMVKEVWLGKSLYLAPTDKLFQYLGLLSPYRRNVSLEHSFLVLLTRALLEADPTIQKICIEVAVGTSGRTVDLVAYLKNGERWAYEITLSSSNVTENAAKLRNRGFARVIFVCRDDALRKSVRTILRDADFGPDFYSTIEFTIFSTLINKSRRFKSKGGV